MGFFLWRESLGGLYFGMWSAMRGGFGFEQKGQATDMVSGCLEKA